MEKSACAWITIFSLLIIIWVLQLGFIVLFGKVFTTIEGNDWLTQKRISSNFDDSAPFLMDVEAIKKNVKHGWAGGALEFPYKFGSQLFFPGVHPLSRSDVEEEKDKEGSGKADFKFEISEDGNPTDEWKKTQEAAYSKYFTKYYKTPDKEIPGCHEKFRSLDGEDLACKWPIKPSTKENSFAASHCERKNGTPVKDENGKLKCFPILYFTINQLIGWIPQKNAADEKYGQIHCELDLEDDIINKGKKQGDFSGNGSCLDWSDDLCGFSFARFPYTGLSKVPSPIIRYFITKMPSGKFKIRCRIQYPAYKKQMALSYPFDQREDRIWTQITISGADKYTEKKSLLVFSLALLISNYRL